MSRPGREDRSGTLRGRGCVRMLGRSLDGSPIGTLWGLLPRMTHGVYPKVRGPVNSDWPGTRRWGPSCREGASGILSGLPRPEAGRHVVGCREAGSGEDSGPSGMGLKEGTMSTMAASRWARRRGPEVLLAVLAGVVFLGFLGALDLWGKREQRASAEALDTVDEPALAGRADPRASPAREAPLAALDDRHADPPDGSPRRVGRPAPRRAVGAGDGRPGLRAGVPPGGAVGGAGVGPGADVDAVLRRRGPAGGQRRPARPVHHAGPLRRLAPAPRRGRRGWPGGRGRARRRAAVEPGVLRRDGARVPDQGADHPGPGRR